ncbi:MAG TPA: ketopantoate reductase family protein [bacterium]|nr:ketopantoate reductase family protein [bacterium]
MRVLVYGAGAVGSLLAAALAESRPSAAGERPAVTLLGRRAHVASVRTWGLIVESSHGRTVSKTVDSVTSLEDLAAPPDVVLLTVKAYQLPEALASLAGVLARPDVPVVILQNGIGSEETAAGVVGPDRTIAGAVTISVEVERPGVIRRRTSGGGVALAPVGPGAPVEPLAALFRASALPVRVYPGAAQMKWSKLLLNLLANASSAILGLPPASIARDPRLFALERQAFREAVRVMRALCLRPVPLPGYPVPILVRVMAAPPAAGQFVLRRALSRGRGDKMPSLWQDLERGRPQNEVTVLNGAVAREGERLGVPVPVNRTLTDILLALAEGRADRESYRHRPDALVAACRARGAPL